MLTGEELTALRKENEALREALTILNSAIDCIWNNGSRNVDPVNIARLARAQVRAAKLMEPKS